MRHNNGLSVRGSNPTSGAALTRRGFLEAGLAVGGGLVVAFHLPLARGAPSENPAFAPNAFIRIDGHGRVTLIMPQVEMGQGIYTAVAMILAEELDADFARVALEHAPPSDKLYANPLFGIQVTGNSNSVRSFWLPLRKAAAGARAMLVQAASQIWKVDPAGIRTENGTVRPAKSPLGFLPPPGARLRFSIFGILICKTSVLHLVLPNGKPPGTSSQDSTEFDGEPNCPTNR